ncbi:homeobox-leucine zipper protein HDG8 [Corchorus olitorius]|uniref:Homeobox-leucine zipper protein HDG8 n=1 Tax=Corchorus olitorius TaxID=93759 RepID=A0A1R3KFE9_9ROSI|nr:homeobox-leucine zipper protein HDG8 [Corchorus olitorius]
MWKKLFSDIIYSAEEIKYPREVIESMRRRVSSIKNMTWVSTLLPAGKKGFVWFLNEISPEISLVIDVSHSSFNKKAETKKRLSGMMIGRMFDQQSEMKWLECCATTELIALSWISCLKRILNLVSRLEEAAVLG